MTNKQIQETLDKLLIQARLYKWCEQVEQALHELHEWKGQAEKKTALKWVNTQLKNPGLVKEEIIITLIIMDLFKLTDTKFLEIVYDRLKGKVTQGDFEFLIKHLYNKEAPLPDSLNRDIVDRFYFNMKQAVLTALEIDKLNSATDEERTILYLILLLTRVDLNKQNQAVVYVLLSRVETELPKNLRNDLIRFLAEIKQGVSNKEYKEEKIIHLVDEWEADIADAPVIITDNPAAKAPRYETPYKKIEKDVRTKPHKLTEGKQTIIRLQDRDDYKIPEHKPEELKDRGKQHRQIDVFKKETQTEKIVNEAEKTEEKPAQETNKKELPPAQEKAKKTKKEKKHIIDTPKDKVEDKKIEEEVADTPRIWGSKPQKKAAKTTYTSPLREQDTTVSKTKIIDTETQEQTKKTSPVIKQKKPEKKKKNFDYEIKLKDGDTSLLESDESANDDTKDQQDQSIRYTRVKGRQKKSTTQRGIKPEDLPAPAEEETTASTRVKSSASSPVISSTSTDGPSPPESKTGADKKTGSSKKTTNDKKPTAEKQSSADSKSQPKRKSSPKGKTTAPKSKARKKEKLPPETKEEKTGIDTDTGSTGIDTGSTENGTGGKDTGTKEGKEQTPLQRFWWLIPVGIAVIAGIIVLLSTLF